MALLYQVLAFSIVAQTPDDQYSLVADGGWQSLTSPSLSWRAYSSNRSVIVPSTVPGQIHLDLERAGVIGNTYANSNQQANAWVKKDSWGFEANFTLSPEIKAVVAGGGEVWLVFDGVDTLGNVYLNEVVPAPPKPVANPIDCFVKHPNTLPNPREPFFAQLPNKQADCAAACIADNECGGFTMHDPSGPDTSICWIYHRPSDTPTSNGTGFRDGDWYSRINSNASCAAPKGGMRVEDQFLRYAFPVADKLKTRGADATHSLTVQLQSVVPLGGWAPVRKEPSNYGYDWSPNVETQGIWLPVYLVGQMRVMLLDAVATVKAVPSNPSTRLDPSSAVFQVSVTFRVNLTAPGGIVDATIDGNWSGLDAHVVKSYHLPAGVSTLAVNMTVRGTDLESLWWPAGYGDQPLHQVKVSVSARPTSTAHGFERPGSPATQAVTVTRNIAFRSVNIIAAPGNATHPPVQTYRVNGVDIFAKGADWVPPDSFEARATDAALCALLESVRDANMNFLRIWGGGILPQNAFFDCADRLGILLEQDEIFSNRVYPTDPAFLQLIASEVRYQARRLASHPSLFLWSGSNELAPGPAGGWWDAVFLDTVFPNLTAVDSSRPVWAACPAYPWAQGVDGGGLPNGLPFEVSKVAREHGPRPPAETHAYWFHMCTTLDTCKNCVDDSFYATTVFASEFGWVGMPSLESLAPVLGDPTTDYTIMSPNMQARENTIVGQQKVANMVKFNFGAYADPYLDVSSTNSFRRAIHMSMVAHSDCLRAEVEHYRRGRDSPARTGGSLFWMLDDNWPAPSWTSLEYGGRRKLLHYEAGRFYSPVAISSYCLPSIEKCTSVSIHIASDLTTPLPKGAVLHVNMTKWADGASKVVASYPVEVGAQSGVSVTLDAAQFASGLAAAGCANVSDCFVTTRLVAPHASQEREPESEVTLAPDNYQWLTLWRDAHLPRASLSIQTASTGTESNGDIEVTITSDHVAPSVMVHYADPDDFGWFSDNGLLVLPGASVKITFTPRPRMSDGGNHVEANAGARQISDKSFYAVSINGASF